MIGKGGMGVVWAGTNERTGKRVALKILRRAFDPDSEVAKLFHREASVASRVNHPNVVTVFDIIDHEQMTCIVMEFLNGEPLNEYLDREGPISIERAAALLLPAMRGVSAANGQGVIHRDLKPHNIFLCVGPDGRMVTSKVLDFGNSLLLENAPGSPIEAGQLAAIGTPAYMAPENIAGSTHYDERVDVYGFGVVLYEALAGRHPFPGQPGPELLTRIMHGQSTPLDSLCPHLSPEILGIVERAMATDPDDRFPNLDPFIRVLEDHVLPVTPLPRSMTPLAGVPVMPLTEPHSGIADAFVQIRRRSEETQQHETQVMYSPNDRKGASPPVARAESKDEARGFDRDAPGDLPPQMRSIGSFLGKPLVQGLLFAAVLALVIWLAFPMPTWRSGPNPASPPVAPPPEANPAPVGFVPDGRPPLGAENPPDTGSIPMEVSPAVSGPDASERPPANARAGHKRLPPEESPPRERRTAGSGPNPPATDTQLPLALPADAAELPQPAAEPLPVAPNPIAPPPESITPLPLPASALLPSPYTEQELPPKPGSTSPDSN
jgi:serine/threonine-protein kinase